MRHSNIVISMFADLEGEEKSVAGVIFEPGILKQTGVSCLYLFICRVFRQLFSYSTVQTLHVNNDTKTSTAKITINWKSRKPWDQARDNVYRQNKTVIVADPNEWGGGLISAYVLFRLQPPTQCPMRFPWWVPDHPSSCSVGPGDCNRNGGQKRSIPWAECSSCS